MSKALNLLNNSSSTQERAARYIDRITVSMTQGLDAMRESIAVKEDKIADLERMDLQTDVNSGRNEMTKDEIESRFNKIFDLKVKIALEKAELDVRVKAFAEYFGDSEVGTDDTQA